MSLIICFCGDQIYFVRFATNELYFLRIYMYNSLLILLTYYLLTGLFFILKLTIIPVYVCFSFSIVFMIFDFFVTLDRLNTMKTTSHLCLHNMNHNTVAYAFC